jgi:hypothetical protein
LAWIRFSHPQINTIELIAWQLVTMGQGAFVALSGSTDLHDSLIYFKKSST